MMIAYLLYLSLLLLLPPHAQPASVKAEASLPSLFGKHVQDGWNAVVSSKRWRKAREMVLKEQAVEDYNGQYIATSASEAEACRHRRLIALPLTDMFDPPMGVFSHGHVQTGDKMSLPQNFWQAITLNKAEVPWLFSVKRIDHHHGVESQSSDDRKTASFSPSLLATPPRVEFCNGQIAKSQDTAKKEDDSTFEQEQRIPLHESVITEQIPVNTTLTEVVGGPLDFRAPTSYIFLPLWIMRALGLRPGEIVQVDLITTVPPGALAKFRPHSSKFAKSISNPQAVLEMELRHYSSLTRGSTIAMDYNGQRYWFDVVDCRAPSASLGLSSSGKSMSSGVGVTQSVPFIKCQDCDIATDFLTDRETRREQARKKRQQEHERRQTKDVK